MSSKWVWPGTNAKMNEIQALTGSTGLKLIEHIIEKRAAIAGCSIHYARGNPRNIYFVPPLPPGVTQNHSYLPIEVDEKEFGMSSDALYQELKLWNVYTRRYFYPLVCDYACYRGISVSDSLSVARRVSQCVLSLPIYDSLDLSDVEAICEIILSLRREKKTRPLAVYPQSRVTT